MLQHQSEAGVKPGRVVVIGAGGFVGGAVVRKLRGAGMPVLGLTRKELDLVAPGATEKFAELLEAGDSVVFVSAIAPARTAAVLVQNLTMAVSVLDALARRDVAHLIYISSDAVYADDANPVTERSACQPSSVHGMMHAARELVLKVQVKTPLAILRPSLLYGAADPHNGYGPNRFLRQAMKGETITLFGDGEEQRDHVHIDDVADLVALVASHRSTGILNIATGVSISFRQVAEMAVALATPRVEIKGTPRLNPITHRHFDIADCLKAFPKFRYRPLGEGLTRMHADISV
jgi:UDP-glucose 4-epimerase